MAIWLKLAILGLAALLSSSAGAQELSSVPVANPAITSVAVTFAVARDRGYFREEGLDAQLIAMPSAVGTQTLIGGNIKFSAVGGAGLLPILRGRYFSSRSSEAATVGNDLCSSYGRTMTALAQRVRFSLGGVLR